MNKKWWYLNYWKLLISTLLSNILGMYSFDIGLTFPYWPPTNHINLPPHHQPTISTSSQILSIGTEADVQDDASVRLKGNRQPGVWELGSLCGCFLLLLLLRLLVLLHQIAIVQLTICICFFFQSFIQDLFNRLEYFYKFWLDLFGSIF